MNIILRASKIILRVFICIGLLGGVGCLFGILTDQISVLSSFSEAKLKIIALCGSILLFLMGNNKSGIKFGGITVKILPKMSDEEEESGEIIEERSTNNSIIILGMWLFFLVVIALLWAPFYLLTQSVIESLIVWIVISMLFYLMGRCTNKIFSIEL